MGKYIDSSGIPKLMVDSGLMAEGSLKGIIRGTHFNRCKNVDSVATLSFKLLHFNAFLDEYKDQTNELNLHPSEIIEILMNDCYSDKRGTTLFELKDILNQYDEYTKKTMNGNHGSTAKYVMMYVKFFELYVNYLRDLFGSVIWNYTHMQRIICFRSFSCSITKITHVGSFKI